MTFRNWRIRHPTLRNVKGLTFVAVVFLVVSILAGCSEEMLQAAEEDLPEQRAGEPQQIDQASDSPFEAPATASYARSLGSPGLNEKVFDAAVIARVRLMDTEATAERLGTTEDGTEAYRGILEFRFRVLEYLKGMGGDELVVSAHIDIGSKEIKHIMDTTARGEPVNWRAVDRQGNRILLTEDCSEVISIPTCSLTLGGDATF